MRTDRVKTSGWRAKSILYSVPLPTPDGPEMTRSRRSAGRTTKKIVGVSMRIILEFARRRWTRAAGNSPGGMVEDARPAAILGMRKGEDERRLRLGIPRKSI